MRRFIQVLLFVTGSVLCVTGVMMVVYGVDYGITEDRAFYQRQADYHASDSVRFVLGNESDSLMNLAFTLEDEGDTVAAEEVRRELDSLYNTPLYIDLFSMPEPPRGFSMAYLVTIIVCLVAFVVIGLGAVLLLLWHARRGSIRGVLMPFFVVPALLTSLVSCGCGRSEADMNLSTDSLGTSILRQGIAVELSADYPSSHPQLQEALSAFIRSVLPADSLPAVSADGQHFLDACGEAMWNHLDGYTWPEGIGEDDSEVPTKAELLAFLDEDAVLSSFRMNASKVLDNPRYVSWLCEWDIYVNTTPHPAYFAAGATFSREDGHRIGMELLGDTLGSGFREELKESLRQWFSKAWDMEFSDSEMAEHLIPGLDVNALPLPKNPPFLVEDGIALPYQEFELTGSRDVQILVLPRAGTE